MLTRVAFEPPTNQQSVRTEPKASSLERSDSPKGKAA